MVFRLCFNYKVGFRLVGGKHGIALRSVGGGRPAGIGRTGQRRNGLHNKVPETGERGAVVDGEGTVGRIAVDVVQVEEDLVRGHLMGCDVCRESCEFQFFRHQLTNTET